MIDEELYQQAADELNSDRRIPHIWARACALASDDHDEARYLYTNLRVEELIAEREAGISTGQIKPEYADDDPDRTLALEPIDGLEADDGSSENDALDPDFGTVPGISADAQDIPSSVSAPSGIDSAKSADDSLEFNPFYSEESDSSDTPRRKSFEEKFDEKFGKSAEDGSAELAVEADLTDEGDLTSGFGLSMDEAEHTAALEEYADEADISPVLDDSIEFDGTAVMDFDPSDLADIARPPEDDAFEQQASGKLQDTSETDATLQLGALGENNSAVEDELASQAQRQNSEQLDTLLSGVSASKESPIADNGFAEDDETILTGDFSDATSAFGELINTEEDPGDDSSQDELDWLDQEMHSKRPSTAQQSPSSPQDEEADRLVRELERQADDLPGQNSDVVASIENEQLDHLDELPTAADIGDNLELDASIDNSSAELDLAATRIDDQDLSNLDASIRHSADDLDLAATQFSDQSLSNLDASVRDSTDELDLAATQVTDQQADYGLDDSNATEIDLAATIAEPQPDAQELPVAAAIAASAASGAAAISSLNNGADEFDHDEYRYDEATDWPIDLTDELSGTRYNVYRRDQKAQAVKSGVSWSALFMTLPFLIYRHLFGTAIVYSLLWIVIAIGLVVSGLAWLDAGNAASPLIKAGTVGFGLLGLVGLIYIPFRYGNSWRAEKLEKRGFELAAKVRAANPGKGIAEARRAAALD